MTNLFTNVYKSILLKKSKNQNSITLWSYIVFDDLLNKTPTKIKITFGVNNSRKLAFFQYEKNNPISFDYKKTTDEEFFIAQYQKNNFFIITKNRFYFYEIVKAYGANFILDKFLLIIDENQLIIDTYFEEKIEEILGENFIISLKKIGNDNLFYQFGIQVLYNSKNQFLIRFYNKNKQIIVELLVETDKKIYYCNPVNQSNPDIVELVKDSSSNIYRGTINGNIEFSISPQNGIMQGKNKLSWNRDDLYSFQSNTKTELMRNHKSSGMNNKKGNRQQIEQLKGIL
jgi:hypothetical protein